MWRAPITLVLVLVFSAYFGAPASEGGENPECVLGYRGGVACTVDWNTSGQRKTACDLVIETVVERAFDGPAARPVHINVLLTGWVHSKSFDVCEFNSLEQPGATKRTITLYVYYPPFERGDWPTYFRTFLTSVRDIDWSNAIAYWASKTVSEDQPNLYVFDSRAHVFIGAKGFAGDELALEKANVVASAALLTIGH